MAGVQSCNSVSTWFPSMKVQLDPVVHQAPPSKGMGLLQDLFLQKQLQIVIFIELLKVLGNHSLPLVSQVLPIKRERERERESVWSSTDLFKNKIFVRILSLYCNDCFFKWKCKKT